MGQHIIGRYSGLCLHLYVCITDNKSNGNILVWLLWKQDRAGKVLGI
ncbi:hypothetical protein X792_06170 [Dehalococcoides mccartyi CG1]|nr:hypothetical protein X792_06170 [Dehalococcoides mccartyi CG1]